MPPKNKIFSIRATLTGHFFWPPLTREMNGIEGVLGQATAQGIVNAEQAAQLLRLFRDTALASPSVGPRSIYPSPLSTPASSLPPCTTSAYLL